MFNAKKFSSSRLLQNFNNQPIMRQIFCYKYNRVALAEKKNLLLKFATDCGINWQDLKKFQDAPPFLEKDYLLCAHLKMLMVNQNKILKHFQVTQSESNPNHFHDTEQDLHLDIQDIADLKPSNLDNDEFRKE